MFDKVHKIKEKVERMRFQSAAADVLSTPPLEYKADAAVTVISMVGHESVNMYLLAVKSFMQNFCRGRIEVIDDGSLTATDRDSLQHHVPGVCITHERDVVLEKGPTYSSWKRLTRIVEVAESSFVVQLDSDTLTLGAVPEVDCAVRSNRPFVITNDRWSEPVPVAYMADLARRWSNAGVQSSLEANLDYLSLLREAGQYYRGCAGFAGYPRGFATRSDLEKLSQEVYGLIGSRWDLWGSEQSATLALLSAYGNVQLLPWPRYQNYKDPQAPKSGSTNLVHYIGTSRFSDGSYRKRSRSLIENL